MDWLPPTCALQWRYMPLMEIEHRALQSAGLTLYPESKHLGWYMSLVERNNLGFSFFLLSGLQESLLRKNYQFPLVQGLTSDHCYQGLREPGHLSVRAGKDLQIALIWHQFCYLSQAERIQKEPSMSRFLFYAFCHFPTSRLLMLGISGLSSSSQELLLLSIILTYKGFWENKQTKKTSLFLFSFHTTEYCYRISICL